MKSLILFLALTLGTQGRPESQPITFSFEASRSGDAPNMRMNLPSGESRDILLQKHNVFRDLPAHPSDCSYLGSFANEPESSVAVTGCLGNEPMQVTIVSRSHRAQYKVSADGSAEFIPDPFTREGVMDVVVKPRNENSTEHIEGDEVVNDNTEAEATKIDCANNPSTEGCTLPEQLTLEIRMHYDQSLVNQLGQDGIQPWVTRVLSLTQPIYYDPTFPARVKLQVVGDMVFHPDKYWRSEDDMAKVAELVKNDTTADIHVFMVKDRVQQGVGTLGIAYLGVMCYSISQGMHSSIIEWQETDLETAKTLAHELGHTLGADHDFGDQHKDKNCTGIMDYEKEGYVPPATWSKCSQNDVRNHYALVMKYANLNGEQHCLLTPSTSARTAYNDN